MTELKKAGPDARTARNVRDSDGTIVIYFHELSGGTAYTVGCCIEQRVPHRLIDAAKYSPEDAVPLMGAFIRDHDVDILNIAGPRASEACVRVMPASAGGFPHPAWGSTRAA